MQRSIFLLSANDETVKRLKSRLTSEECTLKIFNDLDRCGEEFASGECDCMIIDNTSPQFGGFEIFSILQKKTEALSFLIINSGDERLAVEMLTLGVTDYIVKDEADVYLDLLPIKINRILTCGTDPRKESAVEKEKEVQETDNGHLRAVLDAVPGIISWISSDGIYLGVNKNLADCLGQPEQFFVGKSVGFKIDKQPFTVFVHEFFESDNLQETRELEVVLGEQIRQYLMVAQKYHKNTAAVFVGLDITEQKEAENQVRESARKINYLHDFANNLVDAQSNSEVYRLTVEAAEEILNLSYVHMGVVDGTDLVTVATSDTVEEGLGERFDAREGLAGRSLQNKETIVFGTLSEVPEARKTDDNYQSGISVPIDDIGVFQVFSDEPHNFTWIDARLLELLLGHTTANLRQLELQRSLKELAIRDPLTGLYNRNYLNLVLESEMEKAQENETCISILITNISELWRINEAYNRETGDQVLKIVSAFLQEEAREQDIIIRYGNVEFLMILPDCNEDLNTLKSRIIQRVREFNSEHTDLGFQIELAMGTAVWDPDSDDLIEDTLTRADRCLHAGSDS